MQARLRRLAAAAAAATAAAVAGSIPAAGGAAQGSLTDLRGDRAALESRSASALLDLYALETQLASARADVRAAERRVAGLEQERARTAVRLTVARRTLGVAELLLADRLRALYEQGEIHPLAVLLGAETLDDALIRLDGLRFVAEQDLEIVARTGAARDALVKARRTLAARQVEAREAARAAAARAAELERAHAARTAYLARLASDLRLKANQIAALERGAAAAQQKAEAIAASPGTPEDAGEEESAAEGAEEAEDQPARSGRRLTVVATAYALPGRTATGIPVAHGVVAVDPSVIPMGTRMTIPGYGQGVAADVGSAIKGNKIDVWLPTRAQALNWGRRTVTITIH